MHQVGERGPVPNDFETLRLLAQDPKDIALIGRIEAEVERLREDIAYLAPLAAKSERLRAALEDIEKWGEWESAPIARNALAGEKVP
jgi:hypothetical protein